MKFLILRILLPLLIFLVLRSVIRTLFATRQTEPAKRSPEPPPVPSTGGDLKKDPVCGTYVSAGASVQEMVGGQVVYFCSHECRKKFHR